MKNFTLALLVLFCSSCSTNFICVTGNETPIYEQKSLAGEALVSIPIGETVLVQGNKKIRKIKFKNFTGWAYTPYFTSQKKYSYYEFLKTSKSSNTSTYSGGSVKVKGYYRKDGTYVRPHTRSAPKRRKY